MDWISDHPVLAWLALALVLGAVEVATLDLIFVMLAVGALAAALAAALGLTLVGEVLALVVVALLLIGLLRPTLTRRLHRDGPHTATGAAALVGRQARVLETVTDAGGRVRLGGEVWSARTTGSTHLPGQPVRVVSIDGATAVVTADGPTTEDPA